MLAGAGACLSDRPSGQRLLEDSRGKVIRDRPQTSKGATAMLCSLATKLDPGQLEEIGALEKDLGVPILAFACHQMDPAAIDGDQVARIEALETKLGVALVAVSQ